MRSPCGAGLLSCNRYSVGIFVLVASLFMMITITSAPQAAAFTVKVPGDYPSIQDAIDLSDCDILLVEPEYHESVLIHRDVQISGTGTGPTHVIGDPEGGSVFTIAESDSSGLEVVLKNMTIRGGSAAKGGRYQQPRRCSCCRGVYNLGQPCHRPARDRWGYLQSRRWCAAAR